MLPLGKCIRETRLSRRISLTELANIVEVSVSFLSQIENEKNEPSLTTLKKIANALSVNVSRLLGEEAQGQNTSLVKLNERHRISNMVESSLVLEFLSATNPDNMMEVCIHVLDPKGKSGATPYSHDGQEIFYVVKGLLALTVDKNIYQMEEGDCFYLSDCSLPHRFVNLSKQEEARMMCISNPPYFYSCTKR